MKFSTHLRPFNEHDHAAFQGADGFPGGRPPLVADAIPGSPDATVVAAPAGVQVWLGEELFPYVLAYRTDAPSRAKAFCDGLFGPGPWDLTEAELERIGFERA